MALLAVLCSLPYPAGAEQPGWWLSRGVVDPERPQSDYAPLVLGQLKWMATNACEELEAGLPLGAGPEVWSNVRSFSALSNNWMTVNVGQLKAVGSNFYGRLNAEGYYDNGYHPWTDATNDDEDYAIANLGQLKTIFNFEVSVDQDHDQLPDWWESAFMGGTGQGAAGDYDSDGLGNLLEYQNGTRPNNTNTDGDDATDGDEYYQGRNPLTAGRVSDTTGAVNLKVFTVLE